LAVSDSFGTGKPSPPQALPVMSLLIQPSLFFFFLGSLHDRPPFQEEVFPPKPPLFPPRKRFSPSGRLFCSDHPPSPFTHGPLSAFLLLRLFPFPAIFYSAAPLRREFPLARRNSPRDPPPWGQLPATSRETKGCRRYLLLVLNGQSSQSMSSLFIRRPCVNRSPEPGASFPY